LPARAGPIPADTRGASLAPGLLVGTAFLMASISLPAAMIKRFLLQNFARPEHSNRFRRVHLPDRVRN